MRNSNAFLIGFTVGTTIGVVVATVTLKAYFSRECDDKVESVREWYEHVNKTLADNTNIIEENKRIIANIDKPKNPKNIPELHELSEVTNYNGYAKLTRSIADSEKADVVVTDEPDPETYDTHLDDADPVELDEEDLGSLYPTDDDPDPEEIDEDDYEGNPEFEKIDLLYYAVNDVLTDENDDLVPRSFIGDENLSAFDERNSSQIFVRNRSTGADYCVTLVNARWMGD